MSRRGWSQWPAALALGVALALPVSGATPALSAAPAPPAATPAPTAAPAPKVVLPTVRDVRLPNGTRLILAEKHDVPLIAFDGYLRGGGVTDPPGKEVVASLRGDAPEGAAVAPRARSRTRNTVCACSPRGGIERPSSRASHGPDEALFGSAAQHLGHFPRLDFTKLGTDRGGARAKDEPSRCCAVRSAFFYAASY